MFSKLLGCPSWCSVLALICPLHCPLGQGQKRCHFDAVPQAEGCYTLLFLGTSTLCCTCWCLLPDIAVCQSMAVHRPLH